MATIPSRVHALTDSVGSLLPQCDELNISLNGHWDYVPDFLISPKINLYKAEDYWPVDPGDVGKFFTVFGQKGYIFTVDDKFIYPKGYVDYLISKIEEYNRRAVISLHGRNLHTDRPSRSYYHDCKNFYGCLEELALDQIVHELGTGMMAFHHSTVKWPKKITEVFPYRNMTDILASAYFNKERIMRVVAAHKRDWVRVSPKHQDLTFSISYNLNTSDKFVTDVTNAIPWKI
jgi:hypothetical protein